MIRLLINLVREWTGPAESHGSAGTDDDPAQAASERNLLSIPDRVLRFWVPDRGSWGFAMVVSILGCFGLLTVSGFALWLFYSPSVNSAWESVFFIENRVAFGHWIRGIHYLTSDVLIVLVIIYLIYQVLSRSYTRVGGLWFYLTLGLFGLILFSSLVGLLLPWDQQGYWSTRIRLDITSSLPVAGPVMAKILSGSEPLGHLSLTRSTVFHMGLVPPAIISILLAMAGIHAMERKNRAAAGRRPSSAALADILLRSGVVWMVTLLAIVLSGGLHMVLGGEENWGAPHLKGPADPASNYPIARPEWYFLWLFQSLKYFPGEMMIIGTAVIPGILTLFILAMPIAGRHRWGHRANCTIGLFVLCVIAGLSLKAFLTDYWDEDYNIQRETAMMEGRRAVQLATDGIPPQGALAMLKQDPMTRGPELFAAHCASCHRYNGHDGQGLIPEDPQSAPDLFAFASVPWIEKLLQQSHFQSGRMFGGTEFREGEMAEFIEEDLSGLDEEDKTALTEVITALSAQAGLPYQTELDAESATEQMLATIASGREHLVYTFGCVDCHEFELPDEDATAPLLTGYGSKDWLTGFIANPAHPKFYGDSNDRMPAFLDESILTEEQIGLLADWIRQDWKFAPAPDIAGSWLKPDGN
jgi:ubiquinol-cytochrome c reductase cytochrome b subunit